MRQHFGPRLVPTAAGSGSSSRTRPACGTRASSRAMASANLATPQPGAAYRDSDAGYILLGVALERATGRSAASLLERLRVRPAGSRRDPAAPERGRQAVRVRPGPERLSLAARRGWCDQLRRAARCHDALREQRLHRLGRRLRHPRPRPVRAGPRRGRDPARGRRIASTSRLAVYTGAPSWYTTRGGAVQAGSLIGQFGSVPGLHRPPRSPTLSPGSRSPSC